MAWSFRAKKEKCKICGEESDKISSYLSLCLDCIREGTERSSKIARSVHEEARKEIRLPKMDRSEGLTCGYCGTNCKIPEGETGNCGLTMNKDGKLFREFGTPEKAVGSWYKDRHPTNCVASWCCAGGTGAGYPKYARTEDGDIGQWNAAVFLGSCCSHCLYCQNTDWHRMASLHDSVIEKDELVKDVVDDRSITCLCWFGGSPEPQAPFVYHVSKEILEKVDDDRLMRICLEVNGNFDWRLLKKIARLSFKSGGGIKFDLKAWDKNVYRALAGITPETIFKNFERLGKLHRKREEPPFLRASTLLVPGYVDLTEIRNIARFISDVDPTIPYSLLSYAPGYKLADLPKTEKDFALTAKNVAENEGLRKVTIGNEHLLE